MIAGLQQWAARQAAAQVNRAAASAKPAMLRVRSVVAGDNGRQNETAPSPRANAGGRLQRELLHDQYRNRDLELIAPVKPKVSGRRLRSVSEILTVADELTPRSTVWSGAWKSSSPMQTPPRP